MKEFLKKHLSTIVVCALFSLIMLLQLILRNRYVALASFGVAAAGLMFGKKEDRLSLLVFILPFSRIFKFDVGQISFFTFLVLEYIVLVIIDYFIEKKPIPRKALIPGLLYGLLGIYVLIQFVAFRKDVPINRVISIMMYASIPLFYFVDCKRSDEDGKIDIIKFLIFGFAASIFLSLFSYVVPRIQTNLYYLIDDQVGIIQGVRRFSGLMGDSNYFGFYTLGVVSLAFLNLKKLQPKLLYFILLGAIFVLGFLTLSMMYFIVAIVLVVILFVQLLKAKPKIGFISLIAACVVLILIMLIAGDKIMGVIMAKAGGLTISDLTTGRSDIWGDYIKYFINNPMGLLFGHGISANTAGHFTSIWGDVNTAAHNVVLELLYDFGVIGGVLLVAYYLSCLSCFGFTIKKAIKNKSSWIFLLSFILCGIVIELVESDYTPFFLLLLAFSIGTLDKKEQAGLNLIASKSEGGSIKNTENKDDTSVKKNKTIVIPLILSAVSAILSFAFSIIVARGIGDEMYGQIQYYIGIISVASVVLSFGIPNYLNKKTQFSEDKSKFFTNSIILFSIVCAIGIPIFLLVAYFLIGGLNKNITLISMIYIASIFTSLALIVGAYYVGKKEASKSIVFSTIIPHAVILVISIIFLLTKKEELPNYYVYITIFAHIIATAPCLIRNIRKCKFSMNKKEFTLIMSFYVIALTSSLYTQLSKVLQGEIYKNFSIVGIFSISATIISVVSIFLSVISKITMPEFASYADAKDYDNLILYYRKITRVNSYVVVPFLIAIAIQGETLLGMIGDGYAEHMWIFWFLVGASFIGNVTGPTGTMLLMIGHEKYEIFNGVLKMVFYFALGIPLGLNFVWGLPLAIFIADGLINLIKFIEVRKVTGRHPYSIKMLIQLIVLSAISIGVFLLVNMIHNRTLWVIANIVVGCGLILAFFILSPYKDDKYLLFKKRNK